MRRGWRQSGWTGSITAIGALVAATSVGPGAAGPVLAFSITGFSVATDGTDTANGVDNSGNPRRQLSSAVEALGSTSASPGRGPATSWSPRG